MKTEDEPQKIKAISSIEKMANQLDAYELSQVVTKENVKTLVEFIANGEKESERQALLLLSKLAEAGAQLTDSFEENEFHSILTDNECIEPFFRLIMKSQLKKSIKQVVAKYIAFSFKYKQIHPSVLPFVLIVLLEEFSQERENSYPQKLYQVLLAFSCISQYFGLIFVYFLL